MVKYKHLENITFRTIYKKGRAGLWGLLHSKIKLLMHISKNRNLSYKYLIKNMYIKKILYVLLTLIIVLSFKSTFLLKVLQVFKVFITII